MTDAIILTNDLDKIYDFAENFPRANKEKIARTFIGSKNLKLVYKFVKNIERIPENGMNELITFVSQTNFAEYIYLFSTNKKLTDNHLETLGKRMLAIGNKKYIAYLLLLLATRNLEKLEPLKYALKNWLDNYGDKEWMESFNPDIHQELEQKLLNSDDSIQNPFADVSEKDKIMNLQA